MVYPSYRSPPPISSLPTPRNESVKTGTSVAILELEMNVGTLVMGHRWRSEDNCGSPFSLCHMRSRARTQSIKLSSERLYPRSQLTNCEINLEMEGTSLEFRN